MNCEHGEAVKWNPYNQAVQCHKCGTIFGPVLETVSDLDVIRELQVLALHDVVAYHVVSLAKTHGLKKALMAGFKDLLEQNKALIKKVEDHELHKDRLIVIPPITSGMLDK
jgi:hypothetical protein